MTVPDDRRYIPLREASAILGPRFHRDWTEFDVDTLDPDQAATDQESIDRAAHIQNLLREWIVEGAIRAYQDGPNDGSGRPFIDIPPQWYEAASFTICIRTSRFFVFTDAWEPAYVSRSDLLAHLPKNARARNSGRYHQKDVVHQAWKLALCYQGVPSKAELTRLLVGWLATIDLYPDPSTLDDIVSEVVTFLNRNKS